jgi:hypothetical protein
MHEFNAQDLGKLYQNPYAAPPLEHARDDFRVFFQSPEQFSKAIRYLGPELVTYSRLCRLIGDSQAKSLFSSAINYFWHALSINQIETQNILAHVASDAETATSTFWSLLKRYPNTPWRNEANLLRDRVSELLAFAAEYIEGVLKRDMWSILALRDIANGRAKNPLRWQSEKLGNIVSSASALPNPLGPFIGQEPLAGISLHHFRNIGAHKDFSVIKDVITLFPETNKIVVSLQDLENGLEIIGRIRVPLRVSNIIANMHDIDGLMKAGYVPRDYSPEAVAINLTASLGANGIILTNIRHVNQDTEITCSTDQDFTDENLLFSVLRNIGDLIDAYESTFGHTASSKIKMFITRMDGKILEVSCSIDETIAYLNTTGYSEIPFELKVNGSTRQVKLKVNVGDKAMKFG